MEFRRGFLVASVALGATLLSAQAKAHWCDDLWASSYNIVVRPESDTVSGGAMNIYVQNNMGYQLINFKLTASTSGGQLTVTAPTLKSGTLYPGQKATWKISGSSLTKIEDVGFSVSFGNSGQSNCYPTKNAKAVMVVKKDGTLFPAPPALPGLDSPQSPSGCVGGLDQGRSLQYEAMADFEDANTGLDKLMTLYCAGRGSFGSTDGVTMANCKDNSSTTCPASKPTAKTGSKYDYMHLWAAGELAARKSALGATRLATLRQRLRCGVNDADTGFAGYALFMLGYLGEDPDARTFIQSQISGTGDMASIAKAAILLMGNATDMTTYKADVQNNLKASSTFVAAASAAALGIAAKDDASVTGTLMPLVKWTEPDTSDDGQGLFAGHLLGLVAWDRRQWAPSGGDKGAVTFYGDTPTATGGTPGTGGTPAGTGGAAGAGAGGAVASGGVTGSGGNRDAGSGSDVKAGGGTLGNGGAVAAGGAVTTAGTVPTGSGGALSTGGIVAGGGGSKGSGGSSGTSSTGSSGEGGDSGSGGTTAGGSTSSAKPSGGCTLALGGPSATAPGVLLVLAGLAWAVRRRRR